MKPNVVVGLVGAAVFLVTGSVIGVTWRDLTGTGSWQADVVTESVPLGQRVGDLASGATASEAFAVRKGNVSRIVVRATWDEESLTGAQHDVTLTVTDPTGKPVGQDVGRGGLGGLTIDRVLLRVPLPSRFDATAASLESRFHDRYADHPEGRGVWRVSLAANAPSGGTGLTYRVSFDYDAYEVVLHEAEALSK